LKNQAQSRRLARWSAALFLLLIVVVPALAIPHKSESWARSQFDTAERLHAALNAQASADRTRHDYQQVIDAHRRVYLAAPASGKADPSAAAVADLLAEMGRRFNDNALLRKAIRQYEFLRREYPGSKARVDALFTIAEIYQNDLPDSARAQSAFQEFLQRYPQHHLADQARQALAELQQKGQTAEAKRNESRKDNANPAGSSAKIEENEPALRQSVSVKDSTPSLITGVHYSSFSGHTRVTIDLRKNDLKKDDLQGKDQNENEYLQRNSPPPRVKFDSQHLSHPDRIYFDLADSKLASGLNGKTIHVDDPYLKKIRIAQFAQGRSRVVLEVNDQSACDAFVASDPPRLVINIHKNGKDNNSNKDDSTTADQSSDRAAPRMPSARDLPLTTAVVEAPKPLIASVASGSVAGPPESAPVPARTTNPAIKKTIVEADDNDGSEDAADATADSKPAAKSPVTSAIERSQIRASRSVHEAQPTANGDRSLIRALGLKIGKIVIDPGHGGHDTGTIGPNGLTEKDLVLDVSLRLGKLLESRMGAEVDYTRADDTFIPLETRTAIANQDQADLFVSIHANSSHDPDARGVETYYLNFTTSRDALDVAARENSVSDQSIYELQDLVKKIALKEKIEESHEFASDVQVALHSGLSAKNPGLRDRGVKRAPFIVLIGANMPSILAEISFVSNPADERRLKTPEYRQRIAESLYRGISKYVSGLSGVKVASKIDKSSGQ
jgi:N-acetylmuramoyl-L-alanine amidase